MVDNDGNLSLWCVLDKVWWHIKHSEDVLGAVSKNNALYIILKWIKHSWQQHWYIFDLILTMYWSFVTSYWQMIHKIDGWEIVDEMVL